VKKARKIISFQKLDMIKGPTFFLILQFFKMGPSISSKFFMENFNEEYP